MSATCSSAVAALVAASATALLIGTFGVAEAGEYCCTCKGQTAGKTIDAGNRGSAVAQCSLECGGFTNVASGKCVAPSSGAPSPAPSAAAPSTPGPAGGAALAYKSEDCSGEPVRITGSAARLGQGLASFQVESGVAAAWEKTDYAGRQVEFVGPGICVSPGFDIQSVKFK